MHVLTPKKGEVMSEPRQGRTIVARPKQEQAPEAVPEASVPLTDEQMLWECHELLYEIAQSSRPLAGGVQERAWDLLLRHGVIITEGE